MRLVKTVIGSSASRVQRYVQEETMFKASKCGLKLLAPIALVALAGYATGVCAQDQGWYVGGSIGQSKADNAGSCSDLSGIFNPGFACSSNDTSTGWKLFGGYQVNKYFAVEGAYVDLGEFKISASGTVAAIPATASGSDKATGFSLDAVGTLPISEQFGLLARIGIFAWTLDASATASGGGIPGGSASTQDKPTGTGLDFGVGAKYDFARNFGVRAEYQRFQSIGNDNTGKSDVDLISASAVYRFN